MNTVVIPFVKKCSGFIDSIKKRSRVGEERAFVRHPAQIPIEVVSQEENSADKLQSMSNVSMGGMAFESNTYWKPGTLISICVMVNCVIQLHGKVVWCQKKANHFDVGVQFLESPKETTDDMVEKVCETETYKKMLVELAQIFVSEEVASGF